MAITARRLTIEDLQLLSEEHEGDRQELIDGELVVTPVPIIRHQVISMNLTRALDHHVRPRNLGMIFYAPTGVRFSRHDLLIPDICFVSLARLGILGEKFIEGAPDLVIEILSPGTRRRDLTTKRELYARFGVREYWPVDPDKRTVEVLALVGDGYQPLPVWEDGSLQSRVLPDLRLTLEDLFAGI
jgi:Uma2 family endonuclease